jgi:hypothetical protein
VYIIDPAKASLLDSFLSYWPVISPDHRSIAYVRFYPLQGVEGLYEWTLYDLRKTGPATDPLRDMTNTVDVGGSSALLGGR